MSNAENNFELESTSFSSGGSMDSSGNRQVVKRFVYNLVDNSPEKRAEAILDLEKLVPSQGSCMADDSKYVLKSATWNCLDWQNESSKFYIDATYASITNDDEVVEPWDVAPFNITTCIVEEETNFTKAYNSKNKKVVPVVNSAGEPFEAKTKNMVQETKFSFYARNYDVGKVLEFSNSVNASSIRILGQRYKAGTLLLMPFEVKCLTTKEDNGQTEKWKYYQIDMTIRYKEEGWQREFEDIGSKARFNGNKTPELVHQYYPYSNGSISKTPVWGTQQEYMQCDASYRNIRKEGSNLPEHIPYEYAENLPLNSKGELDKDILNSDVADPGFSGYSVRKFNEFKTLHWSSLDIPTEIKKRWRN